MGYSEEMKQVRKMLKREMANAGIKNVSIKSGTGTAYDWTDIKPSKKDTRGYYINWEGEELVKLDREFGIRNPSGSCFRNHELRALLYGHQAKKFKSSPEYQKFREDFIEIGRKQEDAGTCVIGAGTLVLKEGKPIDKIRQLGQSEHRNWVAQQIMKDRAKLLGLELQHEGGSMD